MSGKERIPFDDVTPSTMDFSGKRHITEFFDVLYPHLLPDFMQPPHISSPTPLYPTSNTSPKTS